jgi:hypothetical protein
MSHLLLVSADTYLVSEIEQIASITGTSVTVSTHPDNLQIQQASHVFVDAENDILALNHDQVWVLTSGPAGPKAWQCAARLNAENIVALPMDRHAVVETLTMTRLRRARVTTFIPLAAGIGTSTLACHVAAGLARIQSNVVLADVDFGRGGIDISLGQEQQAQPSWMDLAKQQTINTALMPQLARWNELTFVSSPIGVEVDLSKAKLVFEKICREASDVIVDCSNGSAISEWIALSDSVCVVVPNTLRGIAIARHEISRLGLQPDHVGIAVRQLPGSSISPLMVSQTLGFPLWAAVPTESRVLELLEQGIGPVPVRGGSFNRNVANLLDHLSDREALPSVA